MITVREAVKLLSTAQKIVIGYNDQGVTFDAEDELMLDGYGDYLISRITYIEDNSYDLTLAMRPIKGESA